MSTYLTTMPQNALNKTERTEKEKQTYPHFYLGDFSTPLWWIQVESQDEYGRTKLHYQSTRPNWHLWNNPSNNDKIKFFTSAHKACIRNSEKLNSSGDESRIMRLRGDTNSISFDLGTAYYSLCFICPVSQ